MSSTTLPNFWPDNTGRIQDLFDWTVFGVTFVVTWRQFTVLDSLFLETSWRMVVLTDWELDMVVIHRCSTKEEASLLRL